VRAAARQRGRAGWRAELLMKEHIYEGRDSLVAHIRAGSASRRDAAP
jgi:hypothetical protein